MTNWEQIAKYFDVFAYDYPPQPGQTAIDGWGGEVATQLLFEFAEFDHLQRLVFAAKKDGRNDIADWLQEFLNIRYLYLDGLPLHGPLARSLREGNA